MKKRQRILFAILCAVYGVCGLGVIMLNRSCKHEGRLDRINEKITTYHYVGTMKRAYRIGICTRCGETTDIIYVREGMLAHWPVAGVVDSPGIQWDKTKLHIEEPKKKDGDTL